MNWLKPSWQAVLAIVLCLIAVALGAMSTPEAAALADPTASFDYPYFGMKTPDVRPGRSGGADLDDQDSGRSPRPWCCSSARISSPGC